LTFGPGEDRWLESLATVPPAVNLAELARLAAEAAELADGTPL
jgi:hypothetical protein